MSYTKTDWRRAMLGGRSALLPAVRRGHGDAIVARVRALPTFAACRVLLAYEPLGAEVDPTDLYDVAIAGGRSVYVPATGREPQWQPWSPSPDADQTGTGTAVLPAGADAPLLVLVPGLGFDLRGTRLGRGSGFYDRALATLRAATGRVIVAALAFEAQIVPVLPADPWDQPVDLIVTETRVITPDRDARASTGRDVEEVSDS